MDKEYNPRDTRSKSTDPIEILVKELRSQRYKDKEYRSWRYKDKEYNPGDTRTKSTDPGDTRTNSIIQEIQGQRA